MEKMSAELSPQEWSIVLHALSRLPFGDVATLIFKLKAQVEAQVKKDQDNGA